ncbi:hypothetical protein Acor_55760 [Acrocarpospora corrugata]|uniref:Uncharacterized protein n=1 Tax=Acrocarpospora corrugata TaxID=35763 RepID=A0A5M3W5I0_9ACTN|nr:hypothetical protein [Acrocarpospora corrugata]GES03510.1 hypothetical protein Acor_55760 [Acrocarpospora corrugata]
MRWLVPLVTAMSVVLTPAAASATERRPDPVAALKKQLVSGHGVKVVERRWTYIDHKLSRHIDWIEGVLQFNRGGVAGYEVRVKSGPQAGRIRTIAIGPYAYQSGGAVTKGKTWRRTASKPGRRSPFLTQMMIVEPATLKAVLATTTHFQSGVYRGTISLGKLYAVSPSYRGDTANRPDAREAELTVNWMMHTNKVGLPTLLVTKLADPENDLGYTNRNSEIVFTFWGKQVNLVPPPPGKIEK